LPELITAILIGAGSRGTDAYGAYALQKPDRLKFVAVAEPRKEYRENFAQLHEIPAEMCFTTWEDILKEKVARAAVICTQDSMHVEPTLKALELGYDVLLEKPMASTLDGCIKLVKKAEEMKKHLQICHTLRYTTFWSTIKSFVESGKLGDIISLSHRENVSCWHMAHSYVRGNWRKLETSSPMILAKCCHDFDLIYWILGSQPKNLASFGSLTHYRKERAPPNVPKRCTDGCPIGETCQYNAIKIYIDNIWLYHIGSQVPSRIFRFFSRHPRLIRFMSKIIRPIKRLIDFREWPVNVITRDFTLEGKLKALQEGPYGRCVYHCDNDVVDHQQTTIEFENGTTAEMTMHGHAPFDGRTLRIDGTKGALIGSFMHYGEELWFHDSLNGKKLRILKPKLSFEAHGGGDPRLTEGFVDSLQEDSEMAPLTDARAAIEGHFMSFAAEKSRVEKRVIKMEEYHSQI